MSDAIATGESVTDVYARLEKQGWVNWGAGNWALDRPGGKALLAVERFDGSPIEERRWDLYEDQGDTAGEWRWGESLGIVGHERLLAASEGVERPLLNFLHTELAVAIAFLGRGPGGTNNGDPAKWGAMCDQIGTSLVEADKRVLAALALPSEPPSGDVEGRARKVERLAHTVHNARFGPGVAPYPFDDEDAGGQEYCRRIARAVLASKERS